MPNNFDVTWVKSQVGDANSTTTTDVYGCAQ
jgi:hypothetical protein